MIVKAQRVRSNKLSCETSKQEELKRLSGLKELAEDAVARAKIVFSLPI